MAFVVKDRVRETTLTTGTGTITLAGVVLGYQSFTAIGDGNNTFYTIAGQGTSEWEVGIGTYTASGTTLSRDTVLASSNSGSAVNFSAGTKDVFVTYPAGKAIFQNNLDSVVIAANTTSDALRITQTGSGNALLVEDSANPDATPFVVDANGNGISGATSITALTAGGASRFQAHGLLGYSAINSAADTTPTIVELSKNRNGAIVNLSDQVGQLRFSAFDGTNYIRNAAITAEIDGTPGTNDMPGRLIFNTTADGASTPTERMRIDSAGNVGIGISPATSTNIYLFKVTTDATSYGFLNAVQAGSATTTSLRGFQTSLSTQDAAFTLSLLNHYRASQGTVTGGSRLTPTNQIGFFADSTLTGATNNYGFYSDIASGTGRYNFYANGTADNYFVGNVGVGTTPSYKLDVYGGSLGTTAGNQIIAQQLRVATSNDDKLEFSKIRVAGGSDWQTAGWRLQQKVDVTWHGYIQFNGNNNEGISFGTGTSSVSANSITERMRIDSAGNVGIGGASNSDSLYVAKNITGSTSSSGIVAVGTVQSTVTTAANYFSTYVSTAAAFTLSNLYHYRSQQGTFSGTVTNQYGFVAESSLTGATNNYGFYSNIASGSGRWNFYANGTADNYFAGRVGFGGTSLGGAFGVVSNQITLTGGVDQAAYMALNTIASDVTTGVAIYKSQPTTQAASFTLTSLYHFLALQTGFGAGSTVSNQYGFRASSNLTGATNNYGFYSDIASGTGRYNFYANGTATNFFGGNTIISVADNTNAALRITQTGTGNALLVEDSTNPDATPFVVAADGNVIVGSTSTRFSTNRIEVNDTGGANYAIGVNNWNSTISFGPALNLIKSQSGTVGTNGVVSAGAFSQINFRFDDGTTFLTAASIAVVVDGTPGTNDMPGRLVFSTTADGASTPTERVRINASGLTTVGYSAATGAALSTTVAAKLYSSNTTYTDGITAASGTVTHGTIVSFDNPAIAATNASVTYTNASTLYIDGAPSAGSNVTITNPYALYVAAGTVYFGGTVSAADPIVQQSDIGTGANEIPLNQYLGANAYVDTETPALNVGTGITTGTGTICKANGGLSGGIYRMTILIDLTGLNSGGTAGDIIGVNGTALPCYIAQLPAMTVLGGRMTCLETPAGGDTDIDLYSATEGTGVEDQAITALTETQIINAGTQSIGTVTYFAADPATNAYFYLVGQGTANATYTAGRFLIEIFGVQ